MTQEYIWQHDYHEELINNKLNNIVREKPTVHYHPYHPMDKIVVGKRARVITVDHPCAQLNFGSWVNTSTVMEYNEVTGDFVTRNPKYVLIKAV